MTGQLDVELVPAFGAAFDAGQGFPGEGAPQPRQDGGPGPDGVVLVVPVSHPGTIAGRDDGFVVPSVLGCRTRCDSEHQATTRLTNNRSSPGSGGAPDASRAGGAAGALAAPDAPQRDPDHADRDEDQHGAAQRLQKHDRPSVPRPAYRAGAGSAGVDVVG